tara:strand:+ start:170 stop:397 length:228 start_codon:yes stop_codon:yes gene_type:complete
MIKSIVFVKWNDACEAENYDEAVMVDCIQEAAGFFVGKVDGNYYIARDWNTMNQEYERVLRIPEAYVVDIRVLKE